MPSADDGVAWDTTVPTDSSEVSDLGIEGRETKKAVALRNNKEHVDYAGASVGGEHEKGSAKAYYQASYPTLRPDGTTSLSADDAGRLLVRSGGGEFWLEVWNGTGFTKIRQADTNVTSAHVASGFLSDIFSYAVYSEQIAAATTTGGTFTSGAWRTRTLTTEETDAEAIGALAANQITLAAGTYRVKCRAPALQVNYHQCRFRNVTDGVTVALGTMGLSSSTDATVMTISEAEGEFTITGTKAFELQHICSDTKANIGFGASSGTLGVAWKTGVVEIWKLK